MKSKELSPGYDHPALIRKLLRAMINECLFEPTNRRHLWSRLRKAFPYINIKKFKMNVWENHVSISITVNGTTYAASV